MCSVSGCGRSVIARGWCHRHYKQWKRGKAVGEDGPDTGKWLGEHFPFDSEGCLEWPFAVSRDGYGILYRGRTRLATHVVMEMLGIERPEGTEILHSCDNPRCVNRRHIRWGTRRENVADMLGRGRSRWQRA